MLTGVELHEVVTRAKSGDETAKTLLLQSNSPLIKSIIKRYVGKGVDYDDLYQLGALGFVKAIHKYDAKHGVKFTTYAVPLIAGEVKRFLRDDGSIKVSRSTKTLYTQIKRFIASKQSELQSPTIEDIASGLEVSREDVIYAMEAAQMPLSLYDKTDKEDGDGLSLAERLPAPQTLDISEKLLLKNLLAALDERERKVMILRYFKNQTQSEIATRLGISQVQVSRIEQRVLENWRETVQDEIA